MRTYFKGANSLTNGGSGGIIKTGGKITQENFIKASEYEEQAMRFYEKMLENNEDVVKISKNIGWSIKDVQDVKRHMMQDEIKFKDGSARKFDADIDQALAWKRMIEGKNIKPTDILLAQHELLECKIMREQHFVFEDAHALANLKFNWENEIEKIIDTDELFD